MVILDLLENPWSICSHADEDGFGRAKSALRTAGEAAKQSCTPFSYCSSLSADAFVEQNLNLFNSLNLNHHLQDLTLFAADEAHWHPNHAHNLFFFFSPLVQEDLLFYLLIRQQSHWYTASLCTHTQL